MSKLNLGATIGKNLAAHKKKMEPKSLEAKLKEHSIVPLYELFSGHRIINKGNYNLFALCSLWTIQIDPTLGENSWHLSPENKQLFVSEDIWKLNSKNTFDECFYFWAAVAQVIQFELHGEISRRFTWQVIFWCMGYDPLKEAKEKRELKKSISDAFRKPLDIKNE